MVVVVGGGTGEVNAGLILVVIVEFSVEKLLRCGCSDDCDGGGGCRRRCRAACAAITRFGLSAGDKIEEEEDDFILSIKDVNIDVSFFSILRSKKLFRRSIWIQSRGLLIVRCRCWHCCSF